MKIMDEKLLDILGDDCTRDMLKAMDRRPKSALELSRELSIPQTSCYRKLRLLEENSLVEIVECRLMSNGKRVNYYCAVIRNIFITLDRNMIVKVSAYG